MRVQVLIGMAAGLLSLVSRAGAETIDDFVLTGEGKTITFSRPAMPVSSPSYGAGNVDGGFYPVPEPTVYVNGVMGTGTSLEFLSGNVFVGAGLTLSDSLTNTTAVGARLYSGMSASPIFLMGTFNLHDFYGAASPFVLTITPEAAATPEVSSVWMLLSGGLALAPVCRRRWGRA